MITRAPCPRMRRTVQRALLLLNLSPFSPERPALRQRRQPLQRHAKRAHQGNEVAIVHAITEPAATTAVPPPLRWRKSRRPQKSHAYRRRHPPVRLLLLLLLGVARVWRFR